MLRTHGNIFDLISSLRFATSVFVIPFRKMLTKINATIEEPGDIFFFSNLHVHEDKRDNRGPWGDFGTYQTFSHVSITFFYCNFRYTPHYFTSEPILFPQPGRRSDALDLQPAVELNFVKNLNFVRTLGRFVFFEI